MKRRKEVIGKQRKKASQENQGSHISDKGQFKTTGFSKLLSQSASKQYITPRKRKGGIGKQGKKAGSRNMFGKEYRR
jgi:hypothetical protein